MSDVVYDVGFATGAALAGILTRRQSDGHDPKEIAFTIRPDLSQIEKDKDKPNLGKLFPQNGAEFSPQFPVDNGGFGIPGPNDDAARAERRARLEGAGAVFGERVVIQGNPPSGAAGDAPDPELTKGLGGASAVDQINRDLQLLRHENDLLLAQAAPAIQAGSGVLIQSGAGVSSLGSAVLSFFSIPFSSIMIWLARTPGVADATLDNIPPEQLAQMQARMAHAAAEDQTFNGRLIYEQGADGFLQAVSRQTGEVVIGPGGEILAPELLAAITQDYLGRIITGSRIPGVPRSVGTNVVHIGEDPPDFDYHAEASRYNRESSRRDIFVVVEFLANGTRSLGYMWGQLGEIVEGLLNLASIGSIPENTNVNEMLRRSGIELPEAVGQLLTTAAMSVSPEDFIGRYENITTNVLPNTEVTIRNEDYGVPPITIDVEAEVLERIVEGPEHDPSDIRNVVPPDAGPNFGILRFVPSTELE